MSAAEAKSTVEERARALAERLEITEYPIKRLYITEALRAEREQALEEAERAVRNEQLHEPNPDSEGDQGYIAAIEDALGAILILRSKASR